MPLRLNRCQYLLKPPQTLVVSLDGKLSKKLLIIADDLLVHISDPVMGIPSPAYFLNSKAIWAICNFTKSECYLLNNLAIENETDIHKCNFEFKYLVSISHKYMKTYMIGIFLHN